MEKKNFAFSRKEGGIWSSFFLCYLLKAKMINIAVFVLLFLIYYSNVYFTTSNFEGAMLA